VDAIARHEDYLWPRWMSRWKERKAVDLLDEKAKNDIRNVD
jgi:hypothetical protein